MKYVVEEPTPVDTGVPIESLPIGTLCQVVKSCSAALVGSNVYFGDYVLTLSRNIGNEERAWRFFSFAKPSTTYAGDDRNTIFVRVVKKATITVTQ